MVRGRSRDRSATYRHTHDTAARVGIGGYSCGGSPACAPSLIPFINLAGFRLPSVRAAMKSRGLPLLLCCCVAMVAALLSEGGQAAYYYVPSPPPAPAPACSPATNSSAAPPPAQPQRTTSPTYGVTPGSLHPQECGDRCAARCSATAYRKPCLFFCRKCCAACLCVPAGTYGNKASCPCYDNWKTKRGGPKCP